MTITHPRNDKPSRQEALERLLISIQEQGGLDVPDDEDAFFAHMQTIRQEIYDEEYGHLYDHLYSKDAQLRSISTT